MSTRPMPDGCAAQVADLAAAIAAADRGEFASDEEVRAVLSARTVLPAAPEPIPREMPDPARNKR